MKPVAVSLISSQPISLSKAAQSLSSFVSSKTGASQAVLAYLQRTSVSFDELSQFRSDHKSRKYNRTNHKKIRSQTPEIHGDLTDEGENQIKDRPLRNSDEETGVSDEGRNSGRRKKKREVLDVNRIDDGEKKRKKIRKPDGWDDGNEKLYSTAIKEKEKKRIKIQ